MRIESEYGATRYTAATGVAFVVHKAVGGGWRITEFEHGRPVGHLEPNTCPNTFEALDGLARKLAEAEDAETIASTETVSESTTTLESRMRLVELE